MYADAMRFNDYSDSVLARLKHPSWDLLVDATVIMWFCSAPIKSVIFRILNLFGAGDYTQLVAGVITFIPLIIYTVTSKRTPFKRFIILYVLVAAYFIFTLALFPEYSYWYSRENLGVAYVVFRPDHGALWAVFMVEACESPRRLWNNIKIIAIVMFLYNCLLAINATKLGYWTYINKDGVIGKRGYDLDFGYDMMFSAIVALIAVLKEKKPLYALLVISSIALAFMHGSRGAFLCIITFSIISILAQRTSKKAKMAVVGVLIVLTLAMVFFGQQIISAVGTAILENTGIASRTIQQMASGDLLNDNGRSQIYDLVINALESNPWGYGAFGDRPIVGPVFSWGYSHNIVLEFAIDFGIPLGAVLLGAIVFLVGKTIICCKNEYTVYLIILTESMCMRLLVSYTFWGNNYFWITIGLLIETARNKVAPSRRGDKKDNQYTFSHIMGSGGTNTKYFYRFIAGHAYKARPARSAEGAYVL